MDGAAEHDDHSLGIRAAHWATLALVAAAYALGWSLDAAPSKDQAMWLLMLHRSVGVTILLITLIRLGIRSRTSLPGWPDDLPRWQRRAARWSEVALYGGLLGQPLLGIVGSVLRGDVTLFGIHVPSLIAPNRSLAREILQIHGVFSLCLLALITLHVAAALQHHFVRRDDVLTRMLPALRRLRSRRIAGPG